MSKDTPKPNTTNSEPITTDDLFQGTVLSDNRFSRFDQEIIDKYFNDDGKKAIEALIASKVREAQILTAQFYRGTLSDRDLRELDRQTLNTWRVYEEKLATLRKELDGGDHAK